MGTVRAVRTRMWFICALTAAALVGCTGEPGPAPGAGPTDAPESEAPLSDVVGTVEEVSVTDLSISGGGLYPDGSSADAPVATDDEAVSSAVDEARAWLDAHLTDVQAGGPGRAEVPELVGDAGPVSTGLAGPDHRVTEATYTFTVGVRGAPEWVQSDVVVDREDGRMTATFVFVADGSELSLVAAHVGDGTPVPVDADATDTDPEEVP